MTTKKKMTKAQKENALIAREVVNHLKAIGAKKGYIFDMQTIMLDIGDIRTGKARFVAQLLVEKKVLKEIGQIVTPDNKRRKGYEFIRNFKSQA